MSGEASAKVFVEVYPADDLPSVIHPLVLLSVRIVYDFPSPTNLVIQVVDHASRVPLSKNKRVLGVLLGQDNGRIINVANSSVPGLLNHYFSEAEAVSASPCRSRRMSEIPRHSSSISISSRRCGECLERSTVRELGGLFAGRSQN